MFINRQSKLHDDAMLLYFKRDGQYLKDVNYKQMVKLIFSTTLSG